MKRANERYRMNTSFLFRFLEDCRMRFESNASGTKTFTNVRIEHADSDRNQQEFRSVPLETLYGYTDVVPLYLPCHSGTNTFTEIRQEATDKDTTTQKFNTIPRAIA